MKPPRTWLRRSQAVVGALEIVVGLYLIYPPAALIAFGVLLLVDAIT